MGEWKQSYCLRSQHLRASIHPTCVKIKYYMNQIVCIPSYTDLHTKTYIHRLINYCMFERRKHNLKFSPLLAMTSLFCWWRWLMCLLQLLYDQMTAIIWNGCTSISQEEKLSTWTQGFNIRAKKERRKIENKQCLSRLYWYCQLKWDHISCFQSKKKTKSCQKASVVLMHEPFGIFYL